jgi:hypothetical protein
MCAPELGASAAIAAALAAALAATGLTATVAT